MNGLFIWLEKNTTVGKFKKINTYVTSWNQKYKEEKDRELVMFSKVHPEKVGCLSDGSLPEVSWIERAWGS